jgi:hypothetical protein
MDTKMLQTFVVQSVRDSGTTFTLDGERVVPGDFGDPNCLLPLVVAIMQKIHNETGGQGGTTSSVLQLADPATHMLGWKIKSLPEAPDGALLLLANHAVHNYLSNAPQAKLSLPSMQMPRQQKINRSELRPHLVQVLGLQRQTSIDSTPQGR